MKALLIAEKPSAMRDMRKVYQKINFKDNILFASARGHLLTLLTPDEYSSKWKKWSLETLPIIPNKFKYKVVRNARKEFNILKTHLTSGDFDYIINACDAGREGELIFQSIYDYTKCKIPVKRLWLKDLTDKAISEGLNNLYPDKDFINLKTAAKFRQCFDWLLGMNLSRAIAIKSRKNISVGRVMTPTLAIVVNRELEIRDFVPKTYWEIEGDFEKYKGIWYNEKNKKTQMFDVKKADDLIQKLKGKSGIITEVKLKKNKQFPPSLHSLGELQKEANTAFGYSLDKTLKLAQNLYEKHKVLSYPRTDSKFLSKNMVNEVPASLNAVKSISDFYEITQNIITNKTNINKTLKNKIYVDDSKVTDHHAIIPTHKKPDLNRMSPAEKNVYILVVKRFLSIFLEPCITSITTIITQVEDEFFKTTAKTLVSQGYKILYKDNKKDDVIPAVEKNEKVDLKDIKKLEKSTKPPPRYTDASLVNTMEKIGKFIEDKQLKKTIKEAEGIGTPATRAGIVDKLVKKKMIFRKGKSKKKKMFYATELGIQIITSLEGHDITLPELTALWEGKLKKLENDEYDTDKLRNEILDYTKKTTAEFIQNEKIGLVGKASRAKLGTCPKCGKQVISGKSFYLCEDYKKTCDFIVSKFIKNANITEDDMKTMLKGNPSRAILFTWSTNKKSKAKLKLTPKGKLTFIFINK